MTHKTTILIFTDWFVPGYKAGGPIRSILNLVKALHEYYNIYILTADCDYNEQTSLKGIESDQWINFEGLAQVYYASTGNQNYNTVKNTLAKCKPEIVYLNSMFSLHYTLQPIFYLLRRSRSTRVILNPRGMLKLSALRHKKLKKVCFLFLFKLLGLHRKIVWQFSDTEELKSAQKLFGTTLDVNVIPNFPTLSNSTPISLVKNEQLLKLIFIGRIHPIKNLLFLLDILILVKSQVKLNICGPVEDELYWEKCQLKIEELKSNVEVNFIGPIPFEKINEALSLSHCLVLPTLGENFGHSIFEAFMAGRPVLISDQTPWRNLEALGIGSDLPLDKPEMFVEKIEKMANLSQIDYNRLSKCAFDFAHKYVAEQRLVELYRKLFQIE